MPYLLAGVGVKNTTGTGTLGAGGTDTQNMTGWTIGGGVEAQVTTNPSAFVEYRYGKYGPQDFNVGGVATSESLTESALRAGLNFRF